MPKSSQAKRLLGLLGIIFILLTALAMGAGGESLGASWTSTTSYPQSTIELQSCLPNADFGRIYCIGGYSGSTYLPTVEYSSVTSPGQIGVWTSTTAYPLNSAGQSCFVYAVYIYCVGGSSGISRTSSVYYAQPTTTGLGPWSTTTSYPFNTQLQSCSIAGNLTYCVGGFDGLKYYNSTYYSLLSTSGGLGAWSATTNYPTPIEGQSCVVYSSYIYCIGGYNGSAGTNSVYYASLSASGGIGTWKSTAAYPLSVYGQSCALQNAFVYCVGGYAGTSYTNAVYFGNILPSGGIGGWTSTQPYPTSIQNESCVILSGYIYCVGGFTGSQVTNFVYSDSISAVAPTTVTSTSRATTTVTSTATSYSLVNQTVTMTSTSTATTSSAVFLTTTSTRTMLSFSAVTSTTTLTTTVPSGTTVTVTTEIQGQPVQPSSPMLWEVGAALIGLVAGLLVSVVVGRVRGRTTRSEPEP